MAISIDSVYQRVLALANKEQRGYITPLEFNLFANQAQMNIFEQYFYDLSQFERGIEDETAAFSSMVELIKNKLDGFTSIEDVDSGTTYPTNYSTGKIFASSGGNKHTPRLVTLSELITLRESRFHSLGLIDDPVYIESFKDGEDIRVYAPNALTANVECEVISKPNKAEWGYDVITGKALYNASRSIDFELHESEESLLVLKILELAGITLNKPGLAQTAISLEQAKIQQEKQ